MGVLIEKLFSLWAEKVKPSFLILTLFFLLGYSQLTGEVTDAKVGFAYAILLDGFGVREFNSTPRKIAYQWYKHGDYRYIALRYICTIDQEQLKKRFSEQTVHDLCGIR